MLLAPLIEADTDTEAEAEALCTEIAALLNRGCPQEASAKASAGLAQYPEHAELWNLAGLAYRRINEARQAYRAFAKALVISPHYVEAWTNMGAHLLAEHQPREALRYLRRATVLDPRDVRTLFLLGEACTEEKAFVEAKAAYLAALEIDPRHRPSRLGLSNIAPCWHQPLTGRSITLTSFTPDDAEFLSQSYGNRALMERLNRNEYRITTPAALRSWLEAQSAFLPKQRRGWDWIIRNKDTQEPLGIISLNGLHMEHGSAEFQVGLTDAERHAGKGSEATALVLDFWFRVLRMHRLSAVVYGTNLSPMRILERGGFLPEGIKRKAYYDAHADEMVDLVLFGQLASDYFANGPLLRLVDRLIVGRDPSAPPTANLQ